MKPVIGFLSVAVILAVWWFWPRPVTLTETQYDLAIALYRVCNQASEEGLAEIERLIEADTGIGAGRDTSPLRPIIDTAKSGDWETAAIDCRRMLQDQLVLAHDL